MGGQCFSTLSLLTIYIFIVIVGASLGHCLVTAVGVIAGSFLQGIISERTANMLGAVLFLTFGIMTALEGIREREGKHNVYANYLRSFGFYNVISRFGVHLCYD